MLEGYGGYLYCNKPSKKEQQKRCIKCTLFEKNAGFLGGFLLVSQAHYHGYTLFQNSLFAVKLSPRAKELYRVLQSMIYEGKRTCTPSIPYLAELLDVGERQIYRLLTTLEKSHLIHRIKRWKEGRRTSNEYVVFSPSSDTNSEENSHLRRVSCSVKKITSLKKQCAQESFELPLSPAAEELSLPEHNLTKKSAEERETINNSVLRASVDAFAYRNVLHENYVIPSSFLGKSIIMTCEQEQVTPEILEKAFQVLMDYQVKSSKPVANIGGFLRYAMRLVRDGKETLFYRASLVKTKRLEQFKAKSRKLSPGEKDTRQKVSTVPKKDKYESFYL